MRRVKKKKGEVWTTSAEGHKGHKRTIVEQTAQYQIIKCECGEAERVDK